MDSKTYWLCIIIYGLLINSCTYVLAPETIIKCNPDIHLNPEIELKTSDGSYNIDTAHIIPGFTCKF